MKGLLIFAALLVGAGIYALNNFNQIATPMLNRIVQDEGSPDLMQQAAQQDGFVQKYKPFLDRRYELAKVANIMDDDTMFAIVTDTVARYNGTPLEHDPEFGWIVFRNADLLNQRFKFGEAGDLYNEYLALFPNGDEVVESRNALVGLKINHGVQ